MNVAKRMLALFVAVVASATVAMAQAANGKQELSVEESYLQESIEVMVIREQSRAESRDMKLVALEYIGEAIEGGRGSEEIQKALDYMVMEGVMNKSREGGLGRVTNNYPDVRAKAAVYLGQLGGEAAKDSLLRMVLTDTEPMVLTEAIKSLSKIGLNENDETASTISWIVTRFDVLNPDNTLALAALEAYETLAAKSGGLDSASIRTIMRIAEGQYISPVQKRALAALKRIRQYSAQPNKDTQKK